MTTVTVQVTMQDFLDTLMNAPDPDSAFTALYRQRLTDAGADLTTGTIAIVSNVVTREYAITWSNS